MSLFLTFTWSNFGVSSHVMSEMCQTCVGERKGFLSGRVPYHTQSLLKFSITFFSSFHNLGSKIRKVKFTGSMKVESFCTCNLLQNQKIFFYFRILLVLLWSCPARWNRRPLRRKSGRIWKGRTPTSQSGDPSKFLPPPSPPPPSPPPLSH